MSDLIARLRGPKNRPTVSIPLGNGQSCTVPGLGHYQHDDNLHAEAAAELARLTAENARLQKCEAVLNDWQNTPGNKRSHQWWTQWHADIALALDTPNDR